MQRDNRRALDLGLRFRPLAPTIRGTLNDTRSPDHAPAAKDFGNLVAEPGLAPELNRELSAEWQVAGESA